jgi:hypothetical protein
MSSLDQAIQGLRQAVDGPRRHHMWRWLVRNRISTVKEALRTDRTHGGDAWLAAREMSLQRERTELLRELAHVGPVVLHHDDIEHVHAVLCRLVSRLERYRQRVHDLVYDAVSLELGGSE